MQKVDNVLSNCTNTLAEVSANKGHQVVQRMGAQSMASKVLTEDTMNVQLKEMEYAVRGQVPIAAERIVQELKSGNSTRPYKEVLFCNIGNPHSVGQKPISWYREVAALVDCPSLLDKPNTASVFPADVIARAKELIEAIPGGTGAYSHSQGIPLIRQHVADFITKRDGYECDPNNIFLSNGASAGINLILTTLISGPKDAVLIPIPQYPLYSALLTLKGGHHIGYYLDEESNWGLKFEDLVDAITKARAEGLNPKAMAVINPGNPTGQCMDYDNLVKIVKFCVQEKLVLMADEVYQENVYVDTKKFTSLKKVVMDLGDEAKDLELASFHSTSKGFIGECGRRGGYMELIGFDPYVRDMMMKHASMELCSNLNGQVMTSLMVKPPASGDESYESFQGELNGIKSSLKVKAKQLVDTFNSIEGMTCQPAEGAMYAFPQIHMPQKALDAAKAVGQAPDLFYCLALLEETGICCIPGSGFLQRPGTYHFRTTFLPEESKLLEAMDRFKTFHNGFMAKYS
eukprot:CAMPEP_0197849438 /NCGR_PEP_ID=MMETSP1438-20131217/12073_1 /TAXON_ID=1461541 /ORGANISM="Pterosperma sp., Strain CCMP1384" /LENGTH=515 /DNA_ID=CAMNT_0043462123 /DNA_START=190 /DNA_END=1737 /DNA_ORIENTATION=-